MLKFIVCDLDGTLAEPGKAIKQSTLCKLKGFEDKGIKIAICSGKPTYYLCGLVRQLELVDPILIGENGLDIQFGIDLPPKFFYTKIYPDSVYENLLWIKKEIEKMFDHKIWFQPNKIAVTAFPNSSEQFYKIREFLSQNNEHFVGLDFYEHNDSFDIVPNDVSKKHAIQKVIDMLNIPNEQVLAIGDGINDYPMFEIAKTSVGIKLKDKSKVTYYFDDIDEALEFVSSKII